MWADRVYSGRTIQNALDKLIEEVNELYKDPGEEELADVAILVFDLFHLANIDIGKAVLKKMKINIEERKWQINPKTGILKHVETP